MIRSDRAGHQPSRPQLPAEIARHCIGAPRRYGLGRLGGAIFQVRAISGPAWLKVAPLGSDEELAAECQRLEWLQRRLRVPEVIAYGEDESHAFLLLTEVSGTPSHQWAQTASLDELVERLIEALFVLGEIDACECPFPSGWSRDLEQARVTLAAGKLDCEAFLSAVGREPDEVLHDLEARAEPAATLWTHGDLCLPNILLAPGMPAGFVDWATAGPGSRERDLLCLLGSLERNFGRLGREALVGRYGPSEVEALEAYALLDRFAVHTRAGARSPSAEDVQPEAQYLQRLGER